MDNVTSLLKSGFPSFKASISAFKAVSSAIFPKILAASI